LVPVLNTVLLLLLVGVSAAMIIIPLSVLLWLMEFIARRIAEYPKGPVLGLSALAGGIAGLIKIFIEK